MLIFASLSVSNGEMEQEAFFFAPMDRIIKYIERLLLQHDCVIIPDFGGFVLQSVSAVYLSDEHSFTPSRNEIVFNPTLTHNDGLLVESYMQDYSVDFNKAQQLVYKDVASMKSLLNDNIELQLGSIGFFIKENERIVFMPVKGSVLAYGARSYGLPVFHFLPLSSRIRPMLVADVATPDGEIVMSVNKDRKRGRNVIYSIPVTRSFLRAVAATVAAILLFLFVSTPVSDVNNASYTASFVPQEIMPKKSVDDISSDNSVASPSDDTQTLLNNEEHSSEFAYNKSNLSSENSKSSTSASSKSSVSSKNTTAKSSAVKTGGAKYYVIICSFKSKEYAQAYIKGLKGSKVAANADVLLRDGRARGYAQSFSNEKDAQSYMEELHKIPKHKDAWVYKVN